MNMVRDIVSSTTERSSATVSQPPMMRQRGCRIMGMAAQAKKLAHGPRSCMVEKTDISMGLSWPR